VILTYSQQRQAHWNWLVRHAAPGGEPLPVVGRRPIFLGLALHRWRVRVLELEPARKGGGPCPFCWRLLARPGSGGWL
jgi:hypothetical protein